MTETIKLRGIVFDVYECAACGIPYTVPTTVVEAHRQKGGFHFCSNGHSLGWKADDSTEAKERRELQQLRQRQARFDDELRAKDEAIGVERRSTAAYRGQVTKLKKRAAAGVCACCNRTFSDLQRHMSAKHPEFLAESNVVPLKAERG